MRAKHINENVNESIKLLTPKTQEEIARSVLRMPSNVNKLRVAQEYDVTVPQEEIKNIVLQIKNLRQKFHWANEFGVTIPQEEIEDYILNLPLSREKLIMAEKFSVAIPQEEKEKAKKISPLKEQILAKIIKFNLNAYVEFNEGDLLLLYIEDAIASANLGSQEWAISECKGKYGFDRIHGHKEAGDFHPEKLEPTENTIGQFNNTYQLTKYKKCYFLFDFLSDFPLNKIWFIVDPGGEIYGGWDAFDTQIPNVANYINENYPELNEE